LTNICKKIKIITILLKEDLWQVNVKIAGIMTEKIARYTVRGLQILHAEIG